MVLLQRKLYFSKDPEGVKHFPVGTGVQLLPGGRGSKYLFLSRMYIRVSIEPQITCVFLGGGWGSEPPIPTMDPHINTEAVILIETGV